MNEKQNHKTDILIAIYIFSLVMAELAGAKTFPLFSINGFSINGSIGMLFIPAIYSINDIIFEVYGKNRVRNLSRIALLIITLIVITLSIAVSLPASKRFIDTQEAYQSIFGQSIRISIASITAIGLANLLDIWVFIKIKEKLSKYGLWVRNFGSNFFALFIDTAVFMTLAFYALEKSINDNFSFLISIILPYWILKIVVSTFGTPLVYLGVKWLKEK